MTRGRGLVLGLLLAAVMALPLRAQTSGSYAYRTVFLRAAPGLLLELIDAVKAANTIHAEAGEPVPLIARHAQGDHWDLLILQPIGSLAAYHGPERASRWQTAAQRTGWSDGAFRQRLDPLVAWRQELFVAGPPVAELEARNAEAGFYHLEVFLALAGQRDSLLRQRDMENVYLAAIGRPTNLIFRRIGGAEWDAFTLGFYRDLQHYAQPAAVTEAAEERAAVEAGFRSRNHIGSYLRRFLAGHHDTLLNRVR